MCMMRWKSLYSFDLEKKKKQGKNLRRMSIRPKAEILR